MLKVNPFFIGCSRTIKLITNFVNTAKQEVIALFKFR